MATAACRGSWIGSKSHRFAFNKVMGSFAPNSRTPGNSVQWLCSAWAVNLPLTWLWTNGLPWQRRCRNGKLTWWELHDHWKQIQQFFDIYPTNLLNKLIQPPICFSNFFLAKYGLRGIQEGLASRPTHHGSSSTAGECNSSSVRGSEKRPWI